MLITLKRDIRPPTAPVLGTPVVLGTTSISIPLATAASDPNGIASYTLEYATSLDGTYTAVTDAAIFPQTVSSLTPSTAYFFRAKAVDNYGNHGPYSGIVTATTQSVTPSPTLSWPTHEPAYVSLIPGVGGYGMNTVAGSGRHLGTPQTTIILVNSLATGNTGGAVTGYGPRVFAGTWEYAWRHTASPKVIIPIISGWVTIQDSVNCQGGARSGYVSYYGQFAPGQGLYLRGTNVETGGASNVAVWHLRSYMGDDVTGLPAGNRDCFSSGYGQGVTQQIVLINCEFAWSIDEVAGFFRSHNQVTFTGCAFFEPLHISTIIHPEDGAGFDHGFGPQIGGDTGQPQTTAVSTFRNLWAHTTGRNPLITARTFVHANNLHYNHGRPTGGAGNAVQIVPHGATEANFANVIGNGFIRGPNNNNSLVAVSVTGSFPTGSAGYLFANSQFGWSAPSNQNAFLTSSPSGYAASSVQSSAYPSSWGTGLTGVLQWATNPLAPTLTEWNNYVDLMDRTVGAQPIRRTTGRLKRVFDQIRDRLAGVTQTDQFVDTVTEAGGWFTVPSTTVDPLNPGSEWHAPLPTGSDRDTPHTSGTFSDGKSRVGYTRLEEWAYEQHLYVTSVQTTPVSTGDYDWIDNPVGYTDHWVDPARTTNGLGTFENPYSVAQVMTLNRPSTERHRFIVKPGQLSVTTQQSSSKFAAITPTWGGSEANPVLFKAQYPATRSTTTPSQMTVFRRTAGIGSIFGKSDVSPANYWRIDGIKFEGGNGGTGSEGGNEKANISLWGATGWWITRCWVDGEQADWTSITSTNGAAIYMQGCIAPVVRDVLLENMGRQFSNSRVFQGIELYDTRDGDFSYFTIQNCYGLGFFMKGYQVYQIHFQRNRVHHGFIQSTHDSALHPYYVVAGSNTANHNFWYNIVVDQRGVASSQPFRKCVEMNSIEPHQGTHFQNCTFIGGGECIGVRPGAGYTTDISFRNNIFYQNTVSNFTLIGGQAWGANGNNNFTFDHNLYNGHPANVHAQVPGNISFAQWQGSPYSKDANSVTTAPSFANFAGGDFRANGSNAVPDTWGLFGPQGALIPRGAFQPYGCRRDV